jgi:AraC-like DNA-binding protein
VATVAVACAPSSCSGRFLQLFAQFLSDCPGYDPESLRQLRAVDPASRIPMRTANELALDQVQKTGERDLGLKVASIVPLGGPGAVDYAMHTAATLRDATDVGGRYGRLFSDVFTMSVEARGSRAIIRVEHSEPVARVVSDFAMSVWFTNHARAALRDAPGVEVWFSHPRPEKTAEYERAFAPHALRFSAPCTGLSIQREYLDAPLPGADPALHLLLCEHAAVLLTQLSSRLPVTGRVRELMMKELTHGSPTIVTIARDLRMSARTLSRRLEHEGTNFSELLDGLRLELALRYVGGHDIALGEVAFRLGFSHVEAFYRAFRRWTGQTPLTYRRTRRPNADHLDGD